MDNINEVLPYAKLRFNIEHPSLEECYAHGYECGLKEIDESENPFLEGCKEYDEWQEGWIAGFYREEPIYDITEYFEPDGADDEFAANDDDFIPVKEQGFFTKVLELSSVIAVSAVLGYQVIDMVA